MKWGSKDKEKICRHIRQVREEEYGGGHGAKKAMAKALGIPYTTYLGYEKNRMNHDFLWMFANRFKKNFLWLLQGETEATEKATYSSGPRILTDADQFIISRGQYNIVTMPDEFMEPTVRKGAMVVLLRGNANNPNNKIMGFTDINGDIQIRRVMSRGKKLLGLPDNPMFKQSITIDPTKIIGEAVFQFGVI